MEEPVRPWEKEQLESIDKKEILQWLNDQASNNFLQRHKLKGQIASIAKKTAKPKLIEAYDDLWTCKEWKTEEEKTADATPKTQVEVLEKKEIKTEKEVKEKVQEIKYFTKIVIKKGKGTTFPNKGDSVTIRFKGSLQSNGQVFQDNTNVHKDQALTFKVGVGKVVKGLDEAITTMSEGEKARIIIPAEHAYGKKGKPGVIPPNETLIFEVDVEKVF